MYKDLSPTFQEHIYPSQNGMKKAGMKHIPTSG